jgi:transcriptional regulator with XRE-family HTH domain
MLIGNRLKEARIKLNLTQGQLGDQVGVGKSAICCYEKETRNPSLETIIEFMQILGVSADYLLGADSLVKTVSNDKKIQYRTMTNEEVSFINELRKDKIVYEILFQDPKRGADLVKKKIG